MIVRLFATRPVLMTILAIAALILFDVAWGDCDITRP